MEMQKTVRTVEELQAARDVALGKGAHWNVSGQEVQLMLKGGDKNLAGADLAGADLARADLTRAYLTGAIVIGACGLYSAYAPNLSSRGAALSGGVVIENEKIELRFWAGCQRNITAAALLKCVAETHADNPLHAAQYKAAIKFIQACFKADMAAGKWSYLLDWQAPEKP